MNVLKNVNLISNDLEESFYFYTHILDFSLDKKEKNLILLSNKNTNIILDSKNVIKNDINIFIKEKDFHYFKEKMKRYKINIDENLSLYDPSKNKIFIKLI